LRLQLEKTPRWFGQVGEEIAIASPTSSFKKIPAIRKAPVPPTV
jgi:hypothetical protein